jgi:RNA polymerase sigma-70 factor (ECF subfamily)
MYVEHAADVWRFALFLTRDEAAADDLVSETFLRAWGARERLEVGSLKSYLLTITRNLHRDCRRREGRHEELVEDIAAGEARLEAGIETQLDARRELARVWKAAEGLSTVDRGVLFAHVLEGLPYAEIAERFGIGIGAARLKVYRARMKLMLAR